MEFLLPGDAIKYAIIVGVLLMLVSVFLISRSRVSNGEKTLLLFISLIIPILGSLCSMLYLLVSPKRAVNK